MLQGYLVLALAYLALGPGPLLSNCDADSPESAQPSGGSSCRFSTWKNRAITLDGTNRAKLLGHLATVYGADSHQDCARHCLYFKYCYLAEFQRRGAIGTCELYYYNFPPLYSYESASPLRIKPESKWDQSMLIFNLSDCDQLVPSKHPCKFNAHQNYAADGSRGGLDEQPQVGQAVNAEQCAEQCGSSPGCLAGILLPRTKQQVDDSLQGQCLLFTHASTAIVAAKQAQALGALPVLLSEISCRLQLPCKYANSTLVYTDINKLATLPDVYYGAVSVQQCVDVCGHNPECARAEFLQTPGDVPQCLIYRKTLIDTAPLRTRTSRDYKLRMVDISCS